MSNDLEPEVGVGLRSISGPNGRHRMKHLIITPAGLALVAAFAAARGQRRVGVGAAKYRVEVGHVPVLSGTVPGGVSLPILNAVAAPSKVPMISCCSTAATFTTLSQEGKTGGFFFRTFPTVKMQAYTTAKAAIDRGYKKIAIIYINTDFATVMANDFR